MQQLRACGMPQETSTRCSPPAGAVLARLVEEPLSQRHTVNKPYGPDRCAVDAAALKRVVMDQAEIPRIPTWILVDPWPNAGNHSAAGACGPARFCSTASARWSP